MANEFKVRKGLVVNGSGSVLLDIQGSQGQLFSVTDQLSGSLFSISDISGIPVMEAFSDNTVKIGRYGFEAIKVSGSVASVTGSFSGSFSGSFFGAATSASFAATSSFANSFNVAGNLTASNALLSGTLTAQTLVVQTITSSIDFVTGSTRFGSLLTNTHTFTGSVFITGSLTVNTTGTEFQVNNNGVVMGNQLTDTHSITGSLSVTGSQTIFGNVTIVGRELTGTGPTGFTLKTTTAGAWTAVYGDTGGLYLGTNAGNWMSIMNSGYIGVGSASPKNIFQITNLTSSGVLPAVGAIGNGTSLYLTNNNTGYGMLMGMLPTGDGWIQAQRTDGTATTYNLQLQPNGGDIYMSTSSGNRTVYLKGQTGNGYYGELKMGNLDHSAGIVGRHISAGNANLEFWTEYYSSTGYTKKMTIDNVGNIGAPTGTNIYNASDIRLKQNITTITSGLDKILGLNPVMFNWIDNFVESENGKDMLGFVAQEVQTIIPEAVENFGETLIVIGDTTVENPLRVNEKFIIPVLVKAIQELTAKVTALENK